MRQYFCCWPTASFKWNIGPTYGPYLREERATEKSIFSGIFFLFVQPDFLSSPAIPVRVRRAQVSVPEGLVQYCWALLLKHSIFLMATFKKVSED
jgi:hypothetical protein